MPEDTHVTARSEARPPTAPGAEPALRPLVSQLAQDSAALVKQEIALARAEVRQSIRQTANAAVKLGLAAALVTVGGLVLTAFLVLLLGELLGSYWVSALIVGVIFAIVGTLLALGGARRLKEASMAPEATLETLKEDADWARSEMQELKRDLKA